MEHFTGADLRHGLDEGEIVPFMQPLVDLRTGEINGFEALARWQHPAVGLVLPGLFIGLAEASGLIWDLTAEICRQACRSAIHWPDPIVLSMNISPAQLADRSLPERLKTLAAESGFPLSRLMIEITETGIIDNYETARIVCEDLTRYGIRIALDDFGTGYSSLRALDELQLDRIKIDASFIQSIGERRQSRKLVASMVGLSRNLGLTIVAEGVEQQAQADMLVSLGCDIGQGWLFGKPVSAREATLLAQGGPRRDGPRSRRHSGADWAPRAGDVSDVTLSLDALSNHQMSLLHALYSASPVGLCLLDRDCRFLTLNQRLADLNQRPVSAHLGRTLAEIVPGRSAETDNYLARALAGEQGVIFETEHTTNSGAAVTLLNSFEPVRDEAGEIVGVSCVLIDISAQARAQQELRDSRENYRLMVELNPHIPFTAGPDGDLIEISSRWGVITGTDRNASFGNGWAALVHPDDLASVRTEVQHSRSAGKQLKMQFRLRRADGTYRWVRSTSEPYLDEHGVVVRWYGLTEDIDELRSAIAPLRDHFSSERVLDAVRDAVMVTTSQIEHPGPTIIYVNKAFTQLTEYPANAVIGQSPRLLHGPGTNRAALDQIRTDLLAGQSSHQRVLNYTRSGTLIWLDLHIAPLRDPAGTITHFASVARDVTFETRHLDELTSLAERDTLTGVPNRHYWMRAGRAEFERSIAAREQPPCVAYIDVDRFKTINDRFGHPTGDAVLAAIATRMVAAMRRSDMLGRIGGEEFAVCMPMATRQEALTIAERLRAAIAGTPFDAGDEKLTVTISIGIAEASDRDPDLGTVLDRADKALYEAKVAGGDRAAISSAHAAVVAAATKPPRRP